MKTVFQADDCLVVMGKHISSLGCTFIKMFQIQTGHLCEFPNLHFDFFGLVSLFDGISTFVGYSMLNPSIVE